MTRKIIVQAALPLGDRKLEGGPGKTELSYFLENTEM